MESLFGPEFWAIVESKMREGQRKGQAIVNLTCEMFPEARQLDGTLWDCFYRDSLISDYLERLVDLLTK